ncbi:hypothetical protein WJX75_001193 [Coccomyxa subellipsoidea]|uniref:Uncharacterized protein n=1 Tax=Coccomyxa subellipsoidea TaxID=248742 RepID=A0ABR2YAR8_9CHLO
MATPGITTSPEVLSAASRCPYIQQVVADVGDPQMRSPQTKSRSNRRWQSGVYSVHWGLRAVLVLHAPSRFFSKHSGII